VSDSTNNLCGRCRHRAESIARTDRWRERTGNTGPAPFPTTVDIAPKTECKQNRGYGFPDQSKTTCSEFTEGT
jgi:hypothetical protein